MADFWNVFEDEMKKFRKEMERMSETFKTMQKEGAKIQIPSVNVENKKNEVIVTAELPGVDKKDIILTLEEDKIEIRAKKEHKAEVKKKDIYKKEISYGDFYRSFALPAKIDPKKAKSAFKNGILKVTMPKQKKKAKTKKEKKVKVAVK